MDGMKLLCQFHNEVETRLVCRSMYKHKQGVSCHTLRSTTADESVPVRASTELPNDIILLFLAIQLLQYCHDTSTSKSDRPVKPCCAREIERG